LTDEERALLLANGWREDFDGFAKRATGWWFPQPIYVGPAYSGRQALREVRKKLAKGSKP
jgi:hypothetical protein